MIAYLEGKILKQEADQIIILVNGIGYEVFLPEITAQSLSRYGEKENISLFIYHHQTERQPVPVLIGFENEQEKIFFKRFISVEDIGVIKAVKALTIPIEKIISAIESEDSKTLMTLKGIGKRTAGKIIATLKGKFDDFTTFQPDPAKEQATEVLPEKDFITSVTEVMTTQLGHSPKETEVLLSKALKRNPDISSPEELLEEVYRKAHTGKL
ncbi:MAG: Holliday junction branch migration protein RuvA [Thermodesulfobacteriota bacterium]